MTSLRKKIKKEIEEKCPDLLASEWSFWDYLADKRWALLIFPIYTLLYIISIYVTFPEWMKVITINKAQELNGSSNGILASIVGITMVIIGFIFTELKTKAFVNFKFFSDRTFIFPIFYSSLANICWMFLLSLLSETISIENEAGFNNAVIFSHYLIVFLNIPLIIIIFIRVAKYMDHTPVFESYKEMVLKKAKNILLREKTAELFSNSVMQIFRKYNITVPYSLSSIPDPQIVLLNSKNTGGILFDINVIKFEEDIASISSSHPPGTFEYARFLSKTMDNVDSAILYASKSISVVPRTTDAFKVRSNNKSVSVEIYRSYMEDINQQYIDAVRTNNNNLVVDYLSIYKELFDLYCTTNEKLR